MRGEPRPLSRRASSPDRECRACASSRDLLSRPGSDGCVWPLYAQVPAADDGGLGVAGACRYGRGTVARTVGGVMVLCLLVASVGRGDEGGGWRDRVTLRRAGLTATVGRYEYRDGLETVPGDPTLAALKRMRIAERLVGPFEFTHVTRSFDGVRLAWDRPAWNVTAFGTRPTRGGFEV